MEIKVDNKRDKIINLLGETIDAFSEVGLLEYYIESVIIPYMDSGNNDYYVEQDFYYDPDVRVAFFDCMCGFVTCSFSQEDRRYKVHFKNERTNEELLLDSLETFAYTKDDLKRIDDALFDIFD